MCGRILLVTQILSLEETASLITKLAKSEQSRGLAIGIPVEMADSLKQQVNKTC